MATIAIALSTPPKPDRLFPHQTAIALSTPIEPDRLNLNIKQRSPSQHPQLRSPIPNIKQRSPLTPTNPIAYSLKSNRDRPSPPRPDRLFPQIKQRSPLTPKTRSPFPQCQTAIAPSSPKTPDRLNLKTKQRSPVYVFVL
jgi:hypothetical protein